MTANYICPACEGGFEDPVRINSGRDGVTNGCPWCGETAAYTLEEPSLSRFE